MLSKYFCVKYLYPHVEDIHRKNLQAGNCVGKCQLILAKPQQVKDKKFFKNPTVKMRGANLSSSTLTSQRVLT